MLAKTENIRGSTLLRRQINKCHLTSMTITLSAEQTTIKFRPFGSGTHFVSPIPVNGSHPMYLKEATPKPMIFMDPRLTASHQGRYSLSGG